MPVFMSIKKDSALFSYSKKLSFYPLVHTHYLYKCITVFLTVIPNSFNKYGATVWNGEHTGVQIQGYRYDPHSAAY